MRKITAIATFAVALFGVASVASAIPTGISNPFPNGPYQAKYLDYEEFITPTGTQDPTVTVGDVNQGYAVLQQIAPLLAPNTPGTNTYTWAGVGGGGTQVTTVFSGITVSKILDVTTNTFVTSITPGSGGQGANDSYDIRSTGGTLSIYSNSSNVFNPLSGPSAATAGVLEATANFIPGILPTDPTITVDGVTTSTNPLTGKAEGYLDIIPGSGPWASALDGNAIPFQSFPPGADAFETSDFQALAPAYVTSYYSFTSNDPVIGTASVPEPGTLLLVGVGFIGLAGLGRKCFFQGK